MVTPEELDEETLRDIVRGVVEVLYREDGELNPDKEWSADTPEEIASLLSEHDLVPE